MRLSIDNWLASLAIDTKTNQENQYLTDIHDEDDLVIVMENLQTVLLCNKCQNMWSINFSHSEDLGDHFSLESLTNQDPMLCMKNYIVEYLETNDELYEYGPHTIRYVLQANIVKEELNKVEATYEILKVEEK